MRLRPNKARDLCWCGLSEGLLGRGGECGLGDWETFDGRFIQVGRERVYIHREAKSQAEVREETGRGKTPK